jgi:thiol-disulfide isomerase/thioredoxin
MKRCLLLTAAALAVLTGCNRSGVIDATGATAGAAAAKSATPARFAHGQRVDLRDYIVPGKTTIFDFTSEYCPPCRAIAPALHKLHASRPDIVVVEIDLNRPGVQGIDWQSPVAQQYDMQSIPAFKVYGTDGRLQVEGDEARSYINSLLQ